MKTTKLFLSIALVALTGFSFGMSNEGDKLEFENELVMESDLVMESWMTSPLGLGTELEALTLESWMTTPFDVIDENCTGVLIAAACN